MMAKAINLNDPTEFTYDDESRRTAGSRWSEWLKDFEIFLTAAGISDAAQNKAILLHVVG